MKIFLAILYIAQIVKAAELTPVGFWLVADEDAKVEIYENQDVLEGKIVWMKDSLDKDGLPVTDVENKDEKLRSRPVMNMIFLSGFRKENGEWSGGTIYDAKSGKTYKATMKLDGEKKLKLRGYVGISAFGRTEVWTRQTP